MTAKETKRDRLARAGYVSVEIAGIPGWVPKAYAKRVQQQVEMHREDVDRIAAEPRPRGRPKAQAAD